MRPLSLHRWIFPSRSICCPATVHTDGGMRKARGGRASREFISHGCRFRGWATAPYGELDACGVRFERWARMAPHAIVPCRSRARTARTRRCMCRHDVAVVTAASAWVGVGRTKRAYVTVLVLSSARVVVVPLVRLVRVWWQLLGKAGTETDCRWVGLARAAPRVRSPTDYH